MVPAWKWRKQKGTMKEKEGEGKHECCYSLRIEEDGFEIRKSVCHLHSPHAIEHHPLQH